MSAARAYDAYVIKYNMTKEKTLNFPKDKGGTAKPGSKSFNELIACTLDPRAHWVGSKVRTEDGDGVISPEEEEAARAAAAVKIQARLRGREARARARKAQAKKRNAEYRAQTAQKSVMRNLVRTGDN